MGRGARRDKRPPVRPVEKIELSEEHITRKLWIVAILVVIGAILIALSVKNALTADPGWQTIEVSSAEEESCAQEFSFQYQLGCAGIPAGTESRQISKLFTDTAVKAFRLFHRDRLFEGEHNVAYLNTHVNEVVEVDEVLYHAFALLEESGGRYLYLAPVYAEYKNLFFSSYDYEAAGFDPFVNEEIAAYVDEVLTYANDPQHIRLELLGNRQVKLTVSDEYRRFAEVMSMDAYIDFFWLKNAFIVDYMADVMTENGYTYGSITSYDGFSRNLDSRDQGYDFNLFDRVGQVVYPAAVMEYDKPISIVFFRDYPMNDLDIQHYYQWESGEIRHPYIDPEDGRCKSALANLVCYSQTKGCARIALEMAPIYAADAFDREELEQLARSGTDYLYFENRVLYHSDRTLKVTDLYNKDSVQYRVG